MARKKGCHIPRTLVWGETEVELAAGQMDQAAADGQKNQGRRTSRVLAWGWRFLLVTKVCQTAADGKKKQAAAPQCVLAQGKSDCRWSERGPGGRGRLAEECRRAPHVLVRGWKLPLAKKVHQLAADGKKR